MKTKQESVRENNRGKALTADSLCKGPEAQKEGRYLIRGVVWTKQILGRYGRRVEGDGRKLIHVSIFPNLIIEMALPHDAVISRRQGSLAVIVETP